MNTLRTTFITIITATSIAITSSPSIAQENIDFTKNYSDNISVDYTETQDIAWKFHDELKKAITNPQFQQSAVAFSAILTILSVLGVVLPISINSSSNKHEKFEKSPESESLPISEVNQGDLIYIRDRACTIGYIDKVNKIAYTAGHCGFTDEKVNVMNSSRQTIGTLYTEYSRERTPYVSADQAVIQLNDNVKPGENTFSGDVKLHYTNVSEGDTICSFSRMNQRTMCGTVLYTAHNSVGATRSAAGVRGDSGGPAWIEGKGFVGLYVGFADNDGEDTLFSMIP